MNYNTIKFKNFKHIDKVFRKQANEIDRLNCYRFDRNERISSLPKKLLNIIKKNFKSEYITAYPNLKNIYSLIGKETKLKKENILITAGSDIAIKTCFELLINRNDQIITIYPTYGMVDVYARLFGATQKKVFFKNKLNLETDKIITNINPKTKLIILANPNSPTGTVISEENLVKILKKASKLNTFVLIDECYYGFYKKTFINKIHKFNNLIVSRSLSKAYGLAGCRIGYLASNKDIIKKLYKFKPMHEISSFSAYVAGIFLKNKKIVLDYIKSVQEGLIYFKKFLDKKNISYYKSYANFILVDFKNRKKFIKILKEAKKSKILIHGESDLIGCENCVIFTLGPKTYMKIIEKLILKCLR